MNNRFVLNKSNNENNNCFKSKKRKNDAKTVKNNNFILKNNKKCQDLSNVDDRTKLIVYVKTLFSIYKNLPNIINILDRIIERRASSLMPASSIYNGTYIETYNQVNKVINLTDRKDKLLNLYIIIKKILESLSGSERKLIVLKFIQKNPTHEIAKELDFTERTVYRKINSTLNNIVDYLIKENWGLDFLKNQVGDESWIDELYHKKLSDEISIKSKFLLK